MSPNVPAHSDRANTDAPESVVSTGRQMAYIPIVDGYAVGGGWAWPAKDDESKESHQFLARNPGLGLSGVEVVWPTGWPTDQHGRGLSVQEVEGNAFLEREQQTLARHIREYITRVAA